MSLKRLAVLIGCVAILIASASAQKNEISGTLGRVFVSSQAIPGATFDNPNSVLFPNQFVNVRLLVDTVKDTTVVPVAAIQRGQPGTFVYLVKADDTVEIRVVELGATDGERVQITGGLQVGDQVVIDGTDRLRDGAKIRRPSANPRATSGPPVAAAPPDAAAPADAAQQQGAQPQGQPRRRPGNGNGSADGNGGGAVRPAQTNQ